MPLCRPPEARSLLAVLCAALLVQPAGCGRRTAAPEPPLPPTVFQPLRAALNKSYAELFESAASLEFSSVQIQRMHAYLNQSKDACVRKFQDRARQLERNTELAQKELREKSNSLGEAERKQLHCRIQNNRLMATETGLLARHGIPVAYENLQAKLQLLGEWPAELKRIEAEKSSSAYLSRPFADVKDIGFREVGRGQEADVKLGKDSIDEMRRNGLLPEELKDEAVRDYVVRLAEKIAARSDLRVPVKTFVLNSQEINAFALPGGYLFIQRGLLEAVEDEAQLAGVIAHEIAHAAARHGHRLMLKATIASIIFEAAQVAAILLTGGAVGLGAYYALQYGFYGLGLLLSLDLLGVSREFELEADQLGVQYAWNAGYDPSGFVRFFDKMATREGYVNGLSWFRTHPPFYERMVRSQREMLFLPAKDALVRQTSAFEQMKEALKKVTVRAAEDQKKRPTLMMRVEDCPPPPKYDYKPGEPIEKLCELPPLV